jgi:TRAP-type uncharacterized transport system substrate-binding protein
MRRYSSILLAVAVLSLTAEAPFAQSDLKATKPASRGVAPTAPGKVDANAWTVGVAGGLLEGTFIRYAADLAKVLDDGDNLRVLPIVTYGAVGNINDLLNLKGVDVAITQADVLDHFRSNLKVPNIGDRIQYISPLYLAEMHVYARGEFNSLKDLEGRRVGFNTRGSAANLTGEVVFQRLGISVEPVFINNAVALEKMRTGEISAIVHVVGKPNDLFARFKPEPGFHFLPVEYDSRLADYYVPGTLDPVDYPNLIPEGRTIPTIAVTTVLAVFNWQKTSDRYRRVSRFIEAYFSKFSQLQQPPFQPKWQEVNIAGTVPGWKRYHVAEQVLAKVPSAARGIGQKSSGSAQDGGVARSSAPQPASGK